jgi:hypothetical protein
MEIMKWIGWKLENIFMTTEQEIEREGLKNVIPKQRGVRFSWISISSKIRKQINGYRPGDQGWDKRRICWHLPILWCDTALSSHTYCVGDVKFLQMYGGQIGLELTGSVSQAYMLRWDKLILKKVKRIGIDILIYERYIDDSNQSA